MLRAKVDKTQAEATRLVVHCKRDPFDVYIGRPSVWGNPFTHKPGTLAKYRVATIDEALDSYRKWLMGQPQLIQKAKSELKGKVLGCWCKTSKNPDAPCHGDVLAEIANREDIG